MEQYDITKYLKEATMLDFRPEMQPIIQKAHPILYEKAKDLRYALHLVFSKTNKPKMIEMCDAQDSNPFHLFFYMIVRFYFFDLGDNQIYYLYNKKNMSYFTRMALESLPKRFIRETTIRDTHEYIEMPGCGWRTDDSIDEKWVSSYVRDLYKDIWINTKQEAGKYSYISRNKVASRLRNIENESELYEPLINIGFSIYYMEDLTFAQQIKLFRSSNIITGLHGAGLSYLIFCEPGTYLHEINGYTHKNHYMHLSKQCNLHYTRFTKVKDINDGHETNNIDCKEYIESLKDIVKLSSNGST
jgi:hypothetical protein